MASLKLEYDSPEYKADVEAAFLAMFRQELNAEGQALFTPTEHVALHIENFIRSVLLEHARKVQTEAAVKAIKDPEKHFKNSLRDRVKQNRELKEQVERDRREAAEQEQAASRLTRKRA